MAKLTMSKFFRDQWTKTPPVDPVDISGQTVVVIGANTGLGLEAAIHFAKMKPARLIMACRNMEKAKSAQLSTSIVFIGSKGWC